LASQQQKPYIVLSGGRHTTYPPTKAYPCLIAPAAPPSRTKETIRDEIATRAGSPDIGLRYDPRYEKFFTARTAPSDEIAPVDQTEADLMCGALLNIPNMAGLRSFIILEPTGRTVRSSGDEISQLIKSLEKNKLLREDTRNSRRILLITSPIEASRAFLSFRNQELNAALTIASYPSDSHTDLAKQCPWPIGKQFSLKPKYFLFDAKSFVQSERVWTEVKELVFYTLRFWLRPPLSDERPYFPKSPPTS
jgi:hypothetical protein